MEKDVVELYASKNGPKFRNNQASDNCCEINVF